MSTKRSPKVTVDQIRATALANIGSKVTALASHEAGALRSTMDHKVQIGESLWIGYGEIQTASKAPAEPINHAEIWSLVRAAYGMTGIGPVTLSEGVTRGQSTLSEDFDCYRYREHIAAARAELPAGEPQTPGKLLPIMRRLAGVATGNRSGTGSGKRDAALAMGKALRAQPHNLDAARQAAVKVSTKLAADLLPIDDMLNEWSSKLATADKATLVALRTIITGLIDAIDAPAAPAPTAGESAANIAETVADAPPAPPAIDDDMAEQFRQFQAFRAMMASKA